MMGAEITVGRGLPVTLSTRALRYTRCAAYRYETVGGVSRTDTGFLKSPFGSCDAADNNLWLGTLPTSSSPLRRSDINMIGQSFELPDLWGHGSLYLEGALQKRDTGAGNTTGTNAEQEGNALYAALVTNFGKLTNTLEIKSYRNFYPVSASLDSRASTFNVAQYSSVPTTEPITQDSMFGFFNACVNGGKLRSDYRLTKGLLVYGTAGYFHSKTELQGGACDRFGRTTGTATDTQTYIWDGLAGIEWRFDKDRSQVLMSAGVRNDRKEGGTPFYNERALNYSASFFLSGPYSIEFTGRHRLRFQEEQNFRGQAGQAEVPVPWVQGFHQTAFKIAPKWVIAQGLDYTTQRGFSTLYFNGSLLYRFTSESNIKIFLGQQQGGLRCVNGVCRVFPAFEGARAELTLRY
jgi:Family of unknown function (DUF6029)